MLGPVETYAIDPGPPSGATELIPGIRFLVRTDEGTDPTVDPRQHQGWQWVPIGEIQRVAWIPGMLPQLHRAVQLYNELR